MAKVITPDGENPRDNLSTHVSSVCPGCQFWSMERIEEAKLGLEFAYGLGNSGIEPDREHLLEQHLVDQSRLNSKLPSMIVVAICTPIGAQ